MGAMVVPTVVLRRQPQPSLEVNETVRGVSQHQQLVGLSTRGFRCTKTEQSLRRGIEVQRATNCGMLGGMRMSSTLGLSALLVGLVACGTSHSTAAELNEQYGVGDPADRDAPNCLDLTVVPDAALRSAIRSVTSAVDGQPLTSAQLGSVGSFTRENSGISSLEGIYCLRAMTATFIAGNPVSDLSPLARVLARVSQLDASRNPSVNLASLAGLKLRNLWLAECGLSELHGLPTFEHLNSLYLAGNQLSSLDALPGITSLTQLDLSSNRLVSLSGIDQLRGLMTLELENNQIVDVSPLAGLSKLRSLGLAGNQITDPSPLAALTGLESLDLGQNPLPATADLGELDQLLSLSVAAAELTTLSFVSRLSRLETLDASNNLISDLRPVRALPHLREVELSNNAVTDLTPLAENLDLGIGDVVDVTQNPIDCVAQTPNFEALRLRGVVVQHDCAAAPGAAAAPSATAAPSPVRPDDFAPPSLSSPKSK